MKKSLIALLLFTLLLAASVSAQSKLSHEAQKSFIPKDLGKVYLGMPLKDFISVIPLGKAEADGRFDYLRLEIPFSAKNIETVAISVSGISQREMQEMLFEESTTEKDDEGLEYDNSIERVDSSKIPATAFVYSITIRFKPAYDLKSFALKTYGADGEVRKSDDEFHFFDIQWTKKTTDGLAWLIRSFHLAEKRELQLHGRIEGTEWGTEEIEN